MKYEATNAQQISCTCQKVGIRSILMSTLFLYLGLTSSEQGQDFIIVCGSYDGLKYALLSLVSNKIFCCTSGKIS